MSNPMKDWLDDRAHEYIKADDLRAWIQCMYPDDSSYFDLNMHPDTEARLDAEKYILDELNDWIESNVEYNYDING